MQSLELNIWEPVPQGTTCDWGLCSHPAVAQTGPPESPEKLCERHALRKESEHRVAKRYVREKARKAGLTPSQWLRSQTGDRYPGVDDSHL